MYAIYSVPHHKRENFSFVDEHKRYCGLLGDPKNAGPLQADQTFV